MKKVGICHYRIGRTDGVSLQIKERKTLLESELACDVKLISGPIQDGADHIIPELEFDDPAIVKIKRNAFQQRVDYEREQDLLEDIERVADIILLRLLRIHEEEGFTHLFLHNIFSHGRHIAAAKAFDELRTKTDIHIISVNHDLFWAGSYKEAYQPTGPLVSEYLSQYVPPHSPQIKHITINSIARDQLKERAGVEATVVGDTFDLKQDAWVEDQYNQDFLAETGLREDDLIVLQATRISARKGIELAIDLVGQLQAKKTELAGVRLHNGKTLTEQSRVVLVLAGYAEQDSLEYTEQLKAKIARQGIHAKFISNRIRAERCMEGSKKMYSLWDSYVFADLVTFPSLWEGWGNQFLEAVFAKKLVIVHEYPVFRRDIKPEGYNVISLGNVGEGSDIEKDEYGLVEIPPQTAKKAVDTLISKLTDGKTTSALLDKNFEIAKRLHDNCTAAEVMKRLL